MSLASPNSGGFNPGEMERRVKQFHFVKRFSLSDNKLLMWNKKTILQGNIIGQQKIKKDGQVNVKITRLEIA